MNFAPSYSLAPGVSFCRFQDRLIFLDSVRDRYVGVPLAADPFPGAPLGPVIIDQLLTQGLLIAQYSDTQAISPAEIAMPTRSLAEAPAIRPMARLAGQVFLVNLASRRALSRVPLHKILAEIVACRASATGLPNIPLEPLVATFTAFRRLIPVAPRCLPDSLALIRFLARFHHHPQLVFGVAAYPFAAHCWVQTHEQILDDSHGHAMQFTPILAV